MGTINFKNDMLNGCKKLNRTKRKRRVKKKMCGVTHQHSCFITIFFYQTNSKSNLLPINTASILVWILLSTTQSNHFIPLDWRIEMFYLLSYFVMYSTCVHRVHIWMSCISTPNNNGWIYQYSNLQWFYLFVGRLLKAFNGLIY